MKKHNNYSGFQILNLYFNWRREFQGHHLYILHSGQNDLLLSRQHYNLMTEVPLSLLCLIRLLQLEVHRFEIPLIIKKNYFVSNLILNFFSLSLAFPKAIQAKPHSLKRSFHDIHILSRLYYWRLLTLAQFRNMFCKKLGQFFFSINLNLHSLLE